MIVETAVDGGADMIVNGDSLLLRLKTFKGIKLITVEEKLTCLLDVSDLLRNKAVH